MQQDVAFLKIVNVDDVLNIVVFRTEKNSPHSALLFAYMHDTKKLVYFDPNNSDDFDPTETEEIEMYANERFSVGSDDELATAISSAIYKHYKYVDQCTSYSELVALKRLSELQVEH